MKQAICTGINDYPGSGSDLSGCINDMNNWIGLLRFIGFNVSSASNSEVTKQYIKDKLKALIVFSTYGDVIVFTYSGHGTQVLDSNSDEEDGYDEALYVYDGVLIDDDIREIINLLPTGVQLIIIFDSCFSGTATKSAGKGKIRFVETNKMSRNKPLKKTFLKGADGVEVFLSGCSDSEYSYDAYIGGSYNGAFSYFAVKEFVNGDTYSEWYAKIRSNLPSTRYPQTPQLECPNVNRIAFSGFDTINWIEEHVVPDVENETVEDNPGCIGWIAKLFHK